MDTTEVRRNPTWKVEKETNFSNHGLGRVRLQGPGFSVVSIEWQQVSKEVAAVECLVEGCHLAGLVSRLALLDVSGGESSTTTTIRSSTARSGRRTRRPRRQRAGLCSATGRFRQQPGMTAWCQANCPTFCPPSHCRCQTREESSARDSR